MNTEEILVKIYGALIAAFIIMGSLISKYLFKEFKRFREQIDIIEENTSLIKDIKEDVEELKEDREKEELKKQLRKEIRNELNNEHKRL